MTKQKKPGKNFILAEQIEDNFESLKKASWLIKDLWPESSSLVCIYGKHGSYKSFLALDMSLSISAGLESFHGHDIGQQRPVLYLAGEGAAALSKRVIGWTKHNGIDVPTAFSMFDGSLNIVDNLTREQFINEVKLLPADRQPGVIVIDTLSRFFDGQENNNSDVNAFIRAIDDICQALNCKAVIVHHSGKDQAKGARGGSALAAAVDTEIRLQAKGANIARLSVTKQKDYEQHNGITFILREVDTESVDDQGENIKSLVLTVTETECYTLSKNAVILLEIVQQSESDRNTSVTKLKELYADALGKPVSANALRQSFYRARAELQEKNKIVTKGGVTVLCA